MSEHFQQAKRLSMHQRSVSNILEDDQESQYSFPPNQEFDKLVRQPQVLRPLESRERNEGEVSDSRLDYLKKPDLSSLDVSGHRNASPFGFEKENCLFTLDGDILELDQPRGQIAYDQHGIVISPNPIPIDLNGIKDSIIG